MKKLLSIIIPLLFLGFHSFGQKITFSGSVYYNMGYNIVDRKTTLVPNNDFQIFLLKDTTFSAKFKKIYEAKEDNFFKVKIKRRHRRRYKFIEITSKYSPNSCLINMDTLQHKTYHFELPFPPPPPPPSLEDTIFDIDIDTIIEEKIEPKIRIKPPVKLSKPVMYLYPVQKTRMTVQLTNLQGTLLNTYPTYNDGWEIEVNPKGQIKNIENGRMYNYLFWDGEFRNPTSVRNYDSGFYVRQGEYIDFLEEKLEKIGLNYAEINDFVSFWLPILNKNERSFIYFRLNEDVDELYAKIQCSTPPDNQIRVYMEFHKISSEEQMNTLPKQQLPTFTRKGFTIVEWGGLDVKEKTYIE